MRCIEIKVGKWEYVKRIPVDLFYSRNFKAVADYCLEVYGMEVTNIRYL
jgi:hypothetical protein